MLDYSKNVIENFYPLKPLREYIDLDKSEELYNKAKKWKEEKELSKKMYELKTINEKEFNTILAFLDEEEFDEYWNYNNQKTDWRLIYESLCRFKKYLATLNINVCNDYLDKMILSTFEKQR